MLTSQNYYAPQIFKNLGMSQNNSSLFATGIYGVVKVVSCALFLVFVADSLGRRRSLLVTAGIQGVVLFIVGIYGRVQPPVKGEPVSIYLIFRHSKQANRGNRYRHLAMSPLPASTSGLRTYCS